MIAEYCPAWPFRRLNDRFGFKWFLKLNYRLSADQTDAFDTLRYGSDRCSLEVQQYIVSQYISQYKNATKCIMYSSPKIKITFGVLVRVSLHPKSSALLTVVLLSFTLNSTLSNSWFSISPLRFFRIVWRLSRNSCTPLRRSWWVESWNTRSR